MIETEDFENKAIRESLVVGFEILLIARRG